MNMSNNIKMNKNNTLLDMHLAFSHYHHASPTSILSLNLIKVNIRRGPSWLKSKTHKIFYVIHR